MYLGLLIVVKGLHLNQLMRLVKWMNPSNRIIHTRHAMNECRLALSTRMHSYHDDISAKKFCKIVLMYSRCRESYASLALPS